MQIGKGAIVSEITLWNFILYYTARNSKCVYALVHQYLILANLRFSSKWSVRYFHVKIYIKGSVKWK